MRQMLQAARSVVVITRGMRAPRCNRRGRTTQTIELSNRLEPSRNIARDAPTRARARAPHLDLDRRIRYTSAIRYILCVTSARAGEAVS